MAETQIYASVELSVDEALKKIAGLESALQKAMTVDATGLAKGIGKIQMPVVAVELKPDSASFNQAIKGLKPGKVSVQLDPDKKALGETLSGIKPKKILVQLKPDVKSLNTAIAGLKIKPVTVPVKLNIDSATIKSFREGLTTELMNALSVKQLSVMTGQAEQMAKQLGAASAAGSALGKGIANSVNQGKSSIGGLTREVEKLQRQLTGKLENSRIDASAEGTKLTGSNQNTYQKYYDAAQRAVTRLDTDDSREAMDDARKAVKDLQNLQRELKGLESQGEQLKPFGALMGELQQMRNLGGVPDGIVRSLNKLYSNMASSQGTEFDAVRMQKTMDTAFANIQKHAETTAAKAAISFKSLSQDLADGLFGDAAPQAKVELETLRTALDRFNVATPDLTGINNSIARLRELKAAQDAVDDTVNLEMARTSLTADIDDQFEKGGNAAKLFGDRLREIKAQIEGADKTKLSGLEEEFRSVTKQADALSKEAEALQRQLNQRLDNSSVNAGAGTSRLTGNNRQVYQEYAKTAQDAVNRLGTDSSAEVAMDARRAVKDLQDLQSELEKLENKGKQIKPFDTLMDELRQMRNLGGTPDDIAGSLDELYKRYSNMDSSQPTAFDTVDVQNKMDAAFARIQKSAESTFKAAQSSLSSFSQDLANGIFGDQTDAARAEIESLSTALANFDIAQPDLTGINEAIAKLRELKAAQTEVQTTNSLQISRDALSANIETQFQKGGNAARLFGDRLREIQAQIASADQAKLSGLENEFRTVTKQADALSKAGRTIGDVLRSAFSSFSPVMLAGSAAQYITRNITQSMQTLKSVDTYLTEISKVSDRSASSIEGLGKAAFDAASEYGAQVETYLKGVQEWSRAGYDAQSDELGRVTVLAQAAGDMTSDMATSYLVATNAAYKLQGNAARLTSVLDGQNQITNRNAVSMEELAAATRIAGAQAASAGIEIDKFSAAVGTIQAVTQQGGNVAGRAFKAILMNLQQVTGTTEDGDVIDEKQLNKVERALMSVGIATTELKDGMLQLRDPMQILEELADVFEELDSKDIRKANIVSALGGKMRGSQLTALLDNWDTYQKMLSDFNDNAAGSAAREAEKTAQSWEGAANRVQNSFAKAVSGVLDTKTITSTLNLLSRVVDVTGSLSSAMLNLNPANIVTILTTFKLLQSLWKGNSLLGGLVTTSKEVGAAFGTAKASIKDMGGNWIQRAIAGVRSLGSAFKASANSANEAGLMAGKFMNVIANVGSMAIAMVVGKIASNLVDYISDKIHEAELIAEAANEAIGKYEAAKSENASRRESIAGIKDEFTELLKGVDQNGRNISLTNDEYARYVELSGQIVEILPELTTGYTKNGDALVGVTGQAESFNEVLEQQLSLKQQLAEQEYLNEYDTVRANARNEYTKQAQELPGTDYLPEFDDGQFIDQYRAVWPAVTEIIQGATQEQLDGYENDFSSFVADITGRLPATLRDSIDKVDIQSILRDYLLVWDNSAEIDFDAILENSIANMRAGNVAASNILSVLQPVREALAITVRDNWDYDYSGENLQTLNDDFKALAEGIALSADATTIFTDDFNRIDFAQGLIDDLQTLQAVMPGAADSIATLNSRLDNSNISFGQYQRELAGIVQTANGINPEFGERLLTYINPRLDVDALDRGMNTIREKVIGGGNLDNYLYSLTKKEYEVALKIVTEYDGEHFTARELRERISQELNESAATYQFNSDAYTADIEAAGKKRQYLTAIYSKYLKGENIYGDAIALVNESPEFSGIFNFIKDGLGTEGIAAYLREQVEGLYADMVAELTSAVNGMSLDNETRSAAQAFLDELIRESTLDTSDMSAITDSAQRYKEGLDLYAQAVSEAQYGFEENGQWRKGASQELVANVSKMFAEMGKDVSLAISQDTLGNTIVNPGEILKAAREYMTGVADAAKDAGNWGLWDFSTQILNSSDVTDQANELYDTYIERINAIKGALNSLLSGETLDAQTLSDLDARFGTTLSNTYAKEGKQAVAATLSELLGSEASGFNAALGILHKNLYTIGADTGFIDMLKALGLEMANVEGMVSGIDLTSYAKSYETAFGTIAGAMQELRANGTLTAGTIGELMDVAAEQGLDFTDFLNADGAIDESGLENLLSEIQGKIEGGLQTAIATTGGEASNELKIAETLLVAMITRLGNVKTSVESVDFSEWTNQIEDAEAVLSKAEAERELKGAQGKRITGADYRDELDAIDRQLRAYEGKRAQLEGLLGGDLTVEARRDYQTQLNQLDIDYTNLQTKREQRETERIQHVADAYVQAANEADRVFAGLQDSQSLRTTRGEELTASDYAELIDASRTQIAVQSALRAIYVGMQDGLEEGSERYDDLADKIYDCDDAIASATQSQAEWSAQILETAGAAGTLEKLNTLGDTLKNAYSQQLTGRVDTATAVASAQWLRSMGIQPTAYMSAGANGMAVDVDGMREIAREYVESNIAELTKQLETASAEERADIELELQLYVTQRAEIASATADYTLIAAGLDAITQQSTLAAQAMKELASGDTAALTSMTSLIAQNSEYTRALELNGGMLTLNADKVRALHDAQVNSLRAQVNERLTDSTREYEQQVREIQRLTQQSGSLEDALGSLDEASHSQLITLISQNDALRSTISQYGLLAGALSDAAQACQQWLNRDALPSPDEWYYAGQDAYQALLDGMESGKTGAGTDYAYAREFLFGKGDITEIGENSAKRYYTKGDGDDALKQEQRNLQNFIDDLESWGYLTQDENGQYNIAIGIDIERLKEQTGLSEAAIAGLFQDLTTYGWDIDYSQLLPDSSDVDGLKTQLDAVISNASEELSALYSKGRENWTEDDTERASFLESIIDSYDAQNLTDSLTESLSTADPVKLPFEFDLTDLDAKLSAITTAVANALKGAASDTQSTQSGSSEQTDVQSQTTRVELDTGAALAALKQLIAAIDATRSRALALQGVDIGTLGASRTRAALDGILSMLRSINSFRVRDKSFTITTNRVTNMVTAFGAARAEGSSRPEPGNELALAGELGRELVVRDGEFFYVGERGAEFMHTRPGDIIFSAADTRRIERGQAGARGKAYASGSRSNVSKTLSTALQGTAAAFTAGVVLKTAMNKFAGNLKSTADIVNMAGKKLVNSSGSSSKSSHSSGSSGSSHSSSGSSGSGSSGSGSSGSSGVDELFDWIEVRLDRLEKRTQEFVDAAEDAIGYIAQNEQLSKAMENTAIQIDAATKAYERYMLEADKAAKESGLSEEMMQKVQLGDIDIEGLSEGTRNAVEEYQKWYEKALDMKSVLHDLQEQQTKLATQKMDNIINEYKRMSDAIGAQIDEIRANMELAVSSGKSRTMSDYADMISLEQQRGSIIASAQGALKSELTAGMESGAIVEGSSEYWDYQAKIQNYTIQSIESAQRVQDLINEMNALKIKQLEFAAKEIQYLRDAQEQAIKLRNVTGKLVTADDYRGQIDNILKQAEAQKAVIAEIRSQISATEQGSEHYMDLREKLANAESELRELAIEQAELNRTIIELPIKQYDFLRDKMRNAIDALQDMRDLNDIVGKRNNVADYERMIEMSQKQAEALRKTREIYAQEVATFEEGSELYNELSLKIQDIDASLADCERKQAEWNKAIKETPLERLRELLELLEQQQSAQDAMMGLHEAQGEKMTALEYETLISMGDAQIANLEAQRVELEKLISATEEGSEAYNDYAAQLSETNDSILDIKTSQEEWNDSIIDLEIDKLKEQRDLLDEQNEKYEKRLALEKAIQELERARTQKNQLIYREGQGFIYEADQKAILDAQEALDDQRHQETLDKIDEAIDALEEYKKVDNLYDYFANRLNGSAATKRLPKLSDIDFSQNIVGAVSTSAQSIAEAIRQAFAQREQRVQLTYEALRQQFPIGLGGITINAINMYGVQDADGLARGIAQELPSLLSQKLYSNR